MNQRIRELSRQTLRPQEKGVEALVSEIMFHDRRGYYLHVQTRSYGDNGIVSFNLLGGKRVLIEPAARFNARRLAAIVVNPEVLATTQAIVRAEWESDLAKYEAQAARRHAENAARAGHVCADNPVPYVSDGPLGHGFECAVCKATLQVG